MKRNHDVPAHGSEASRTTRSAIHRDLKPADARLELGDIREASGSDSVRFPSSALRHPERSFAEVFSGGLNTQYDVSPEGDRFVMIQGDNTSEIRVTLHFDEELRKRLP